MLSTSAKCPCPPFVPVLVSLWPLTGCPASPSSNLPEASCPAAKPSSWQSVLSCPCAHVTHSVPNAFCLPAPHAPGNFLLTHSDRSKQTSVLLRHLFTPLKPYHSNIIASLFVILPIRLQIPRGKDLGFFLSCSLSYCCQAWLTIGHQWINMP